MYALSKFIPVHFKTHTFRLEESRIGVVNHVWWQWRDHIWRYRSHLNWLPGLS